MADNKIFPLSDVLEYTDNKTGGFEKTGQIEFLPPSYFCIKEATMLSQLVTRAVLDITKFKDLAEGKKQEDQDMDAAAVKMLLMSSSSVNFPDILTAFKRLSTTVCKLSDKEFLKEAHFEKMEYDDVINMICEYVANFIIPSLF